MRRRLAGQGQGIRIGDEEGEGFRISRYRGARRLQELREGPRVRQMPVVPGRGRPSVPPLSGGDGRREEAPQGAGGRVQLHLFVRTHPVRGGSRRLRGLGDDGAGSGGHEGHGALSRSLVVDAVRRRLRQGERDPVRGGHLRGHRIHVQDPPERRHGLLLHQAPLQVHDNPGLRMQQQGEPRPQGKHGDKEVRQPRGIRDGEGERGVPQEEVRPASHKVRRPHDLRTLLQIREEPGIPRHAQKDRRDAGAPRGGIPMAVPVAVLPDDKILVPPGVLQVREKVQQARPVRRRITSSSSSISGPWPSS